MNTREQQFRADKRSYLQTRKKLVRQGRILTAIAIAFIIIIIIIITLAITTTMERQNNYKYTSTTSYYVEEGDTLWFIAQQYSDNRHDVRIVIDEIEKLSQCNANLQIGQLLTIPLYDVMQADN